MKFQANHFAVLGACLVSLAAMGSAVHDWGEILKPGFVFGALGVIGTNIAGFYTRRPNERRDRDRLPARWRPHD